MDAMENIVSELGKYKFEGKDEEEYEELKEAMEKLKKLNTAKMIISIAGAAIQLVIGIILLIVTIMTMATNRHFGFGQFLLYNGLMLLSLGVFVLYIIFNSIETGKSKSVLSGEKTFAQECKSLTRLATVQIIIDGAVIFIYSIFFMS